MRTASIGNLINLESLSLSNNQLTGEIPSSIENLTNSWIVLNFSYNQLSGMIPSGLCTSDYGNYIDVSYNNLCQPYPFCISEDDMNSQNPIQDCPPCGNEYVELWGECYSTDSTTELILSNNQLTGEIPPEIGNFTNLIYLDLSNNELIGEIPIEIENLTNLEFYF